VEDDVGRGRAAREEQHGFPGALLLDPEVGVADRDVAAGRMGYRRSGRGQSSGDGGHEAPVAGVGSPMSAVSRAEAIRFLRANSAAWEPRGP
jgi:hypothetical protein